MPPAQTGFAERDRRGVRIVYYSDMRTRNELLTRYKPEDAAVLEARALSPRRWKIAPHLS